MPWYKLLTEPSSLAIILHSTVQSQPVNSKFWCRQWDILTTIRCKNMIEKDFCRLFSMTSPKRNESN